MLNLLLAEQVASNYFIDLADGIKLVSNLGLDINFSRDIIIEAKKKVLEEVKKYYADNIF